MNVPFKKIYEYILLLSYNDIMIVQKQLKTMDFRISPIVHPLFLILDSFIGGGVHCRNEIGVNKGMAMAAKQIGDVWR